MPTLKETGFSTEVRNDQSLRGEDDGARCGKNVSEGKRIPGADLRAMMLNRNRMGRVRVYFQIWTVCQGERFMLSLKIAFITVD